MCGIVYNYNFGGETASNRVLKQYRRQIHRGSTSYGFALPDKHVMNWKVKYGDVVSALKRTKNPEILFHHRLSTSTADRPTSCHPFSTKDVFKTEFVGVHNGVLYNEHDLYALHKERFGIRYVSDNGKDFNDSEAYIYDLASYFSGLTEGIEMTGYGAFIVVEYDKKTHERLKLHWGTTNTSSAPLKVHHTKNHLDITSEGKGWLVEKDVHYVYDYKTGDITQSPLVHKALPYSKTYSPYYNSGYSGYDDDYYNDYYNDTYSPTTLSDVARQQYLLDGDSDYVSNVEETSEPAYKGHYGWSMYMDGCCGVCDEEMEITGDFSALSKPKLPYDFVSDDTQEATRTAVEAIIVQRALDARK